MVGSKQRYKAYPEYKDSGVEWLGKIPSGWALTHLKFIASIFGRIGFRGYTVDDIVDEDEGAIVLSPSNIKGDKFCLEKKAYLSWKKYFESPEIMVEPSDILLVKTGSTFGKSTIIQDVLEPMTVNPQMVLIKKSSLDSRFLAYLLNSSLIKAYIDVSNTGSGMPTMTQENINSFPMLYPPNRLDVKIANFLDYETAKIDTLIEKQQRLIELLTEKRQAVISHAVTKGLNPDVPMKDSGVEWLGEVPEHWEVKRLKYLCKISTGTKDTVNAVEDGKYPFFVRSQTVERINSYSADCEAVLTAGDGVGVGKVYHYINGKFDYHQRVYMLSEFNQIAGRFLYYYLSSNFYKVALQGNAKSTVDSLRLPQFLNFEFSLPPMKEQSLIVSHLESHTTKIDGLIKMAQKQIQLMQERRTALISAAVTGKIDVRDWVKPE